MNRVREWGLKEGAELRKGERVENDMVSRMERAMGEVDEDGLEMTTEGADEGDEDEDEGISSEGEMISDKSSEEEDLTSPKPRASS